MKNRERGNERGLRRWLGREQRSLDEPVEELLLELARRAFALMGTACVRRRTAVIAHRNEVLLVQLDGAVAMGDLDRRSVGKHDEQHASKQLSPIGALKTQL
ncbi:MAG TPA: hypothetical protein PLF26_20095 [Blastocatellia bacterium]|nr:hypothetical protein [Blastocatellia bacterium]